MQGSVKHVETVVIEEYESAQHGRDYVFSLKSKGKTQYFAGEDEQDRLNWIVECIKMRSIAEIIEMCSHPKLSRHSAMALCNQSSNQSDNIQLDIVKFGGVDKLLEFIDKHEGDEADEKLFDAIYFAISKLASRPENRRELSKHLPRFFDLACKPSVLPHWRQSAGGFIHECAHDDVVKKTLLNNGSVARLVDLLVMDKKAPPLLQREAARALLELSNDADIKRDLGLDLLLPLVDSIGPAAKAAQPPLLQTLISIASDRQVLPKMLELPEMLPAVLPMLSLERTLPEEDVQTPAALFLVTLSTHAPNLDLIEARHGGLRRLLDCAASKSHEAVVNVLRAMQAFLTRAANQEALARQPTASLLALVTLVGEHAPEARSLALTALVAVCRNERALVALAARLDVVDAIVANVAAVLGAEAPLPATAVLHAALEVAARLAAASDSVKIRVCRVDTVFADVMRLLNTVLDGAGLRHAVELLASCAATIAGKLAVGRQPTGFTTLINAIQSTAPSEQSVLRSAVAAIALCAAHPSNRHSLSKANPVPALVARADAVPTQAARALRNIAACAPLDASGGADGDGDVATNDTNTFAISIAKHATEALLALLVGDDAHARDYAAQALANCSGTAAFVVSLRRHGGAKQLLNALTRTKQSATASAAIAQACGFYFGSLGSAAAGAELCSVNGGVRALLALVGAGGADDDAAAQQALWALSQCSRECAGVASSVAADGGLRALIDCVRHAPSDRSREGAATVLVDCVRHAREHQQVLCNDAALFADFVGAFASVTNMRVVKRLARAVAICSDNATARSAVGSSIGALTPLIYFPNPYIRSDVSRALINCASDKNNMISLSSMDGLSALVAMVKSSHVDAKPLQPWAVRLGDASDKTKRFTVGCADPANNALFDFTFASRDDLLVNLAATLAIACYQDTSSSADEFRRAAEAAEATLHNRLNKVSGGRSFVLDNDAVAQQQQPQQPQPSSQEGPVANVVRKHRSRKSASSTPRIGGARDTGDSSSPLSSSSSKKRRKKGTSSSSATASSSSSSLLSAVDAESAHVNAAQFAHRYPSVSIGHLRAIAHYRSVADPRMAERHDTVEAYLSAISPKLTDALVARPQQRAAVLMPNNDDSIDIDVGKYTAAYTYGDCMKTAIVQGSQPLSESLSFPYFEVLVINDGVRSCIGVGLAPASYPRRQQPGWLPGSFGYHGDDGNKYGDPSAKPPAASAADSDASSSSSSSSSSSASSSASASVALDADNAHTPPTTSSSSDSVSGAPAAASSSQQPDGAAPLATTATPPSGPAPAPPSDANVKAPTEPAPAIPGLPAPLAPALAAAASAELPAPGAPLPSPLSSARRRAVAAAAAAAAAAASSEVDDTASVAATTAATSEHVADPPAEEVAAACRHASFGPTFTSGDVIGCGYNNITREIFFTKNGLYIGAAFTDIDPALAIMLVPTVGLASPDERIYVNLGQVPFLFDFDFEHCHLDFEAAPEANPNNPVAAPRAAHRSRFTNAFGFVARDWSFTSISTLAALTTACELVAANQQQQRQPKSGSGGSRRKKREK
jgi:SPRY domain